MTAIDRAIQHLKTIKAEANAAIAELAPLVVTQPPAPPSAYVNNVAKNPQGFFDLPSGGPFYIVNQTVNGAPRGVNVENDKDVTELFVINSSIRSTEYAMYVGDDDSNWLDRLRVDHSNFFCDGVGVENNYCLRGLADLWESNNSTYKNIRGGKACFRLTGVKGGYSTDDVFEGDRVMLGAGPADERVGGLGFGGTADAPFVFTRAIWRCSNLGVYPSARNVIYRQCDFSDCDIIGLWDGCWNIRFEGCTNHGAPLPKTDVGLGGIDWAIAAQRGIVVTP